MTDTKIVHTVLCSEECYENEDKINVRREYVSRPIKNEYEESLLMWAYRNDLDFEKFFLEHRFKDYIDIDDSSFWDEEWLEHIKEKYDEQEIELAKLMEEYIREQYNESHNKSI